MIVFAPCKVNLGLYITEKRMDGFHNLETIFYPIRLYDVLEIIKWDSFHFSISGDAKEVALDDNLCIQAIKLLIQENYLDGLPHIWLHLHKNIPTGAGLGGGSSNASHTLLMLNEYLNLNLSTEELLRLAKKLGSDCPFFIESKPCVAKGRGEVLDPIHIDLSEYKWVLVRPSVSISTRWAYQHIKPKKVDINLHTAIQQPLAKWESMLSNDFEEPVFKEYPELKRIKQILYDEGAQYASMSGSGSVIFGIFDKHQSLSLGDLDKKYQILRIK